MSSLLWIRPLGGGVEVGSRYVVVVMDTSPLAAELRWVRDLRNPLYCSR